MRRRYLLTCESLDDDDERARKKVIRRLGNFDSLSSSVILRIPIQWDQESLCMKDPVRYKKTFEELSKVKNTDLMLACVDSDAAMNLTEAEYSSHVENCIDVLGKHVSVVEVGNEINCSNWFKDPEGKKPHPHDSNAVVRMVKSALDLCKKAKLGKLPKLQTAVTFYLGADDESDDESPFTVGKWLAYAKKIPSDYALISYYPNSAEETIAPDDLRDHFANFSSKVAASSIGWGEYGTEGEHTNVWTEEEIIRMVEHSCWTSFSSIQKYEGFGGYWDWQLHDCVDAVFRELWKS